MASVAFFGIAIFTHTWRIGAFYAGDTLTDLGLTLFFGWLALRTDRWWPLAMTAVMVLTLLVHATSLVLPDLPPYANVSARIGLGILSSLILLAGAGERWLAGEAPVSPRARWKLGRATMEADNGGRLS